MTGLPLNLFQRPSFAQSLSVLVGEDGHYDNVTATIRRPTELDIGPPGSGVVLRVRARSPLMLLIDCDGNATPVRAHVEGRKPRPTPTGPKQEAPAGIQFQGGRAP